jgi:hypothetical protein
MRIGLSFDVEEFNASVQWLTSSSPAMQTRVFLSECSEILEWLKSEDIKATFFVQGSLFESCMELLSRMLSEGHEIGVHGYNHVALTQIGRAELEEQLSKVLRRVERELGFRIQGYRAPYLSLSSSTGWLLPMLRDLGFIYDSSGGLSFARHIFGESVSGGAFHLPDGLFEIPISYGVVSGVRLIPLGGGFFRWMPLALFRKLLTRELRSRDSAVLYFHNYEFNVQRLPPAAWSRKLRHPQRWLRMSLCARSCGPAVKRSLGALFAEFEFSRLCDLIPDDARSTAATRSAL